MLLFCFSGHEGAPNEKFDIDIRCKYIVQAILIIVPTALMGQASKGDLFVINELQRDLLLFHTRTKTADQVKFEDIPLRKLR